MKQDVFLLLCRVCLTRFYLSRFLFNLFLKCCYRSLLIFRELETPYPARTERDVIAILHACLSVTEVAPQATGGPLRLIFSGHGCRCPLSRNCLSSLYAQVEAGPPISSARSLLVYPSCLIPATSSSYVASVKTCCYSFLKKRVISGSIACFGSR